MSKVFLTFFKVSPKILRLILMATAGMMGFGGTPTVANEPPADSQLSQSQTNFNHALEDAETTNSAILELSELSETFPASQVSADNYPLNVENSAHENLPVTSVNQLSVEAENSEADSMAQVTSVSQLSDVQPTDWAFQALQNLVERYGCIAGYPDGTFRGNRALTRYEFAAGLNACLDAITGLITEGGVPREELDTLNRLMEEFAAELATLRGRIDVLEARTAELEANQFSTTTKLLGEVAIHGADVIGDGGPAVPVLQEKIRLQLVTSFTGRDFLYTRLTTGNIGNSFADELGTNEGRFAYDGIGDNVWQLDRLHYVFPVGKNLTTTVMASLGGHHFYADTFNPGLEAGGGATGALSRFGERNPIYRLGLGGQGIGLRYQLGKSLEVSAGYLARGGDDPQAGMFHNNYSALGQLVFKPSNKFKLGLTYIHSYDVEANRRFNFGGTGTNLGNLNLTSLGVPNTPVTSNSYGIEAMFNLSPRFSIRGWAGLTKARLIKLGDADIWNYSLIFAFPDLGKRGNLAAIIVGAEPYLKELDVPNDPDFSDDIPWHIEAMYKYQVTDNISITPGVIWLLSPNQNDDNNDAVIGTVRTTFTF
jgi:hypothetical protein